MSVKEKKFEKGLRIYNLFPRLVGPIIKWEEHLARIEKMGFNCLFINPFHLTGTSGSLYSIKDYEQIDPDFLSNGENGWEELGHFLKRAKKEGLLVVVDLVINHTAVDSNLINLHPKWYKYDKEGHIQHPFCRDPGDGGKITIWKDLAEIENEGEAKVNGLWAFWDALIERYMSLGIDGFRCDAAYKIPPALWEYLITRAKARAKGVFFLAETLGCSEEETIRTAQCGFDYIYNSSKWWDFSSDWCLRQYEMARQYVNSISFPETHDTPRLCEETQQNIDLCKQRYLFAALFSTGVMIPIGYEYGFRQPLHVVDTTPQDWEESNFDLVDFIHLCNALKDQYQIFNQEGEQYKDPLSTSEVLVLKKHSLNGKEKSAIILNKTAKEQKLFIGHPQKFLNVKGPIQDISPEDAVKTIPPLWEISLHPYQVKVLYAG